MHNEKGSDKISMEMLKQDQVIGINNIKENKSQRKINQNVHHNH